MHESTLTDYVLAPWWLRKRWEFEARFWRWCAEFSAFGPVAPAQVHPYWYR